jgi:hypothetical protein
MDKIMDFFLSAQFLDWLKINKVSWPRYLLFILLCYTIRKVYPPEKHKTRKSKHTAKIGCFSRLLLYGQNQNRATNDVFAMCQC